MATVTFRDETATGKPLTEWRVTGLPDRMTVRALIRLRVREEVARHNARPSDRYYGLVRPDDAVTAPHGYRLPGPRRLDWRRQADTAEQAFRTNAFFLLAGDRQAEELDETVDLTTTSDLVFIKLVALVGG
ncbi:hypothetical protein ACFVZC_14820 [Streptomyces marokkonensis]|uniref:DUF58 domain-containing protein n=1 Tax=Streptomyces marokkonensis TaxID=324855 RepID=A0ABW6Q639_9ACTN